MKTAELLPLGTKVIVKRTGEVATISSACSVMGYQLIDSEGNRIWNHNVTGWNHEQVEEVQKNG